MNSLDNNDIYYLDANAIYYYCGEPCISIDTEKFQKDLKSIKYKIIPSCVYREIIVHNQYNLNELARITKILGDDNFIVAPSQFDNINYFFVNYVKNYKAEIENQINLKIYNESTFIYMVSFLVFHIFVTSLTIKHDIIYYDLLMIFVNEYFNMNRTSLINGIKNRLKQDYFNADKITKKILTDLFEKYGKYFEEYLIKLLNNKYSFTLSTEEYFKYVDLFIEIKKYLKNNNNFLSYFSKIYKMNHTLINYQADDLKTFFKDNNLTELQANVLISRIKGVLLDKTNFNKNDIYDLFYLYSYSEESLKSFNKNCHTNFKINNIILLSFDKNLMKSIHKISNKSEEIINSYKI